MQTDGCFLLFYKVTAVRTVKLESWKSFVSTITSDIPLPQIWKKTCKIAGKFVPDVSPVLHFHDSIVADPVSVATELCSPFSTGGSSSSLPSSFLIRKHLHESCPIDFRMHLQLLYNDLSLRTPVCPDSLRFYGSGLRKRNIS